MGHTLDWPSSNNVLGTGPPKFLTAKVLCYTVQHGHQSSNFKSLSGMPGLDGVTSSKLHTNDFILGLKLSTHHYETVESLKHTVNFMAETHKQNSQATIYVTK